MELFLKDFIDNVEAKRKIKERTYIKRTMKKKNNIKDKKTNEKKKNNNHEDENDDSENNEDLPKYKPKKYE